MTIAKPETVKEAINANHRNTGDLYKMHEKKALRYSVVRSLAYQNEKIHNALSDILNVQQKKEGPVHLADCIK